VSVLSFAPLADRAGLVVHDGIEDVRFEVHTDRPVEPTAVAADRFRFPVGAAVSVRARQCYLPRPTDCYVRTPDGSLVAEAHSGARTELDAGEYEVELTSLPMKLYLRLSGPFVVRPENGGTLFECETAGEVAVGARSFHDRPAATVTTTDDPVDLMRAVSTFGSALKTHSPERSFPTLRGHPPLLELGDELSIPDTVVAPESGVTVAVPPRLAAVFRVTPLAYYLGATVEPGPETRVVAGDTVLPLSEPGVETETAVNRFLQRTFFLDCVVRTEGLYRVDLHERAAVEDALPFDPATVYHASPAERLVAYDEVPFEVVEPYLPRWPLLTDVQVVPENVGYLPFAAKRLSLVRVVGSDSPEPVAAEPAGLTDFMRGETGGIARATSGAPVEREQRFFDPPPAPATTQAWLGEGYPLGAVKPNVAAMQKQAVRAASDDGRIRVRLVCNDEEMEAETAGDLYGLRDLLEFDVTLHRNCSVEQLRSLFREQTDFFHYIGHIDDDGLQCTDGALDLRELDRTGVEAFLLNACQSYEQGEALVEAGAWGGIVTLSKVYNTQATRMGRSAARLLNQGYPLDATLAILGHGPLSSHRYAVVGDHRYTICQSDTALPSLTVLTPTGEDDYDVEYRHFFTDVSDLGTIAWNRLEEDAPRYLMGSHVTVSGLSRERVVELLAEDRPVLIDGRLSWGWEVGDEL
jgi:hypothetical protein